jgi:ribonuclease J
VKIVLHRGSGQIGGSIVEVEHQGTRILLDLGLPLPSRDLVGSEAHPFDNDPPPVPGVFDAEPDHPPADAVFVSHAHLDHAGHLPHMRSGLPVHATPGTWELLRVSSLFRIAGALPEDRRELRFGQPVQVGPLTVTPFPVDHSAPDAAAFLVEGGGRSVIYSGDLRRHGRKTWCFPDLLKTLPRQADALLLEGTSVGSAERLPPLRTEAMLEDDFADIFRMTDGLSMVFASGQNLDRTVTVYRAARKAGRTLVMDLYTAYVQHRLRGLSRNLPQHDWDGIRVKYWPNQQETLFQHDRAFLQQVRASHIHMTELVNRAPEFVLLARHNRFLKTFLQAFPDPTRISFVWSMWAGYLSPDSDLLQLSDFMRIQRYQCHTSGHAQVEDLQALAGALAPRRVIPIHTKHPEGFDNLFENVVPLRDGETLDLDFDLRGGTP